MPPDTKESATDYTAKEALLILIGEFIQRQQAQSRFSDYDAVMQQMRSRHSERSSSLHPSLKKVADDLFAVSDNTFFIFHILNWKIYYLAEGIQRAVESANPVSLANNARALLEHIATFSALGQEIESLESNLYGQQSEDKILKAIATTQDHLKRVYYGQGTKSGATDSVSAIHINDSIKALKREILNADEIYGHLCEFVHPNYLSNQLVSSGTLSSGQLNTTEEANRRLLDELRRICSYCFIYLKGQTAGHLAGPIRLHSLLERAFSPGAKLNTIFGQRPPSVSGDGKSIETAYFFPKARTPMEAMQMTNEFLALKGLTLTGSRGIGSVQDGNIYDVYPTNAGDVWFKIPVLKM
jgi:hypothetical protein